MSDSSQKNNDDYKRGEKLGMLRELNWTNPESGRPLVFRALSRMGNFVGTVSARACQAVLRVVDDHSGSGPQCWLKQDTIARESVLSKRTARRAISVLSEIGFITVDLERKPGWVRTYYRICWSNIDEHIEAIRSALNENSTANQKQVEKQQSRSKVPSNDVPNVKPINAEEFQNICERLFRILPVKKDIRDVSLVAKVTIAMIDGLISEQFLENVIEAFQLKAGREKTSCGYFHAVCASRYRELFDNDRFGGNFNSMLRSIKLPESLLQELQKEFW